MSINLSTFWTTWGVSSGDTSSTNQYDFWRGLIMTGGTRMNSQYDFFKFNNTTRYEFFKNLNSTYPEVWDETTFYQNTNDARIYDYNTFYTYAAQSLPGGGVTPTPTPTPTPNPTPTPTPTPLSGSISPISAITFNNVTLSGSSNYVGATYIWSLSNFKNTSDTTVTSYTGQTLTEGYFTSSGSSNVTLTIIASGQTATTSNFNVVSFSPTQITNLKSWHDATQGITLVGGDVDQWADQSGNGYTLTAPTATERPTYGTQTLNGLSILGAAAGGKKLFRNTYGLNSTVSGATIYIVGTQFSNQMVYGRLLSAGFSQQFWIGQDGDNDNMQGGYQANTEPYGSIVAYTPGTYYTVCLSGTTSQSNLILNNSSSGSVFTYNPNYSDEGIALFSNANNEGDYANSRGAAAEIIIFDKTVSSSENTTITRYLRNKWQHY